MCGGQALSVSAPVLVYKVLARAKEASSSLEGQRVDRLMVLAFLLGVSVCVSVWEWMRV